MGQYREWLAYRERDQIFHQQLERAEQELATVEQQLRALHPLPSLGENAIIRALMLQQAFDATLAVSEPAALSTQPAVPNPIEDFSGTTQPELAAIPSLPATSPSPYARVVPAPSYDSLSSDTQAMAAIHENEPPDYPDWLRRAITNQPGDIPIDPQTIHTNRLVQRWLARWGRQNEAPQQKERR